MAKELPVYVIYGTTFEVMADEQALREKTDPQNKMYFYDMEDLKTHYRLIYDPDRKNAANENSVGRMHEERVPKMVSLAPAEMAKYYGVPKKDITSLTDYEVIVPDEVVTQRMRGHLPRIYLGEVTYLANGLEGQLHLFHHDGPSIDVHLLPTVGPKNDYVFYFDLKKMTVFEVPENITKIPPGLVQVRLPNIKYLDPVGVAERLGINQQEFLRKHPPAPFFWPDYRLAVKTELKQQVARNLQKQLQAPESGILQQQEQQKKVR